MARKVGDVERGGDEEFGQVFGPMAILARWEHDEKAWHFPTSMIERAAGTSPCYVRAREERQRKILAGEIGTSTPTPPPAGHLWRTPAPGIAPGTIAAPAPVAAMDGGEW